jgi:hypothetical protein
MLVQGAIGWCSRFSVLVLWQHEDHTLKRELQRKGVGIYCHRNF